MKNYSASLKLAPFALIILLAFAGISKCNAQTDSTAIKLDHYKQLFINGTITSAEYETLRKQVLGIEIKPQEVKIVEVKPDTLTKEQQVEANNMFRKGEKDAYKHFKTGGVFAGTFITTLFCSPILGLIPAIVCSSSPPKQENFANDNPQLFKDESYLMGYKKEARKNKRSSAWAGWGGALGVQAMVGIVTGVVMGTRKTNPR